MVGVVVKTAEVRDGMRLILHMSRIVLYWPLLACQIASGSSSDRARCELEVQSELDSIQLAPAQANSLVMTLRFSSSSLSYNIFRVFWSRNHT